MNNLIQGFQGKRILVTGHTGFKGFWLSTLLEAIGAEVVGLSDGYRDTSLYALAKPKHQMAEHFIDIRNRKSIESYFQSNDYDAIFHLAAQPLVLESYKDPLTTFETNVLGTANIISSATQNPRVKFILVITTDKVYENDDSGTPFSEGARLGGHDPYSASKAAAEIIASSLRGISEKDGPQIITARAGNVIGGGDDSPNRLIPDLVRSLSENLPISIRNPASTRPWQHVLDPLAGYLRIGELCLEGKPVSHAYNLGPGKSDHFSVEEVCAAVGKSWGSHPNIQGAPQDWSQFREAKLLSLDSSLAERELGWRNKLSTAEAIEWTVEWEKIVREYKGNPLEQTRKQVERFLSI
jgi:CDP-glucose 4,6-dehydratase